MTGTPPIGGFILVENNRVRSTFPSSTKPRNTGPRTELGIYLVVVQAGPGTAGMTAKDLAYYMKSLGAVNAMNLDNSGSSQLLYSDGSTVIKTLAGDRDAVTNDPAFRPVPIFLGIE